MYTPGLWRYEESTKTIRSIPSNYWLATMDSWDGSVDHAANARLISVAPELFDACRMAQPVFQQTIKDHPGNLAARNCLALINQVIAKVEGLQ